MSPLRLKGKLPNGFIVKSSFIKEGKTYAICICPKCKNQKEYILHLVKNYKSCGCTRFGLHKQSPRWKGEGDLSGTYFSLLKHGAIKRNIQFSVSKDSLWKLFLKQEKRCAISGLLLSLYRDHKTLHNASLDRIDSSKGYIKRNVQWVHKDINEMKWEKSMKDFLKYVEIIYQYNH